MSVADEYRAKAAEMAEKAKRDGDPLVQAEFEALRRNYLRLALQAEKNAKTDIVYETPSRSAMQQQQQHHQQQQPPPKAKS